jgi:hypothetical protein
MKRLIKPLFLMLLLHVTLNLQAQDFRNSIETGEDLPSFYPYLGFEEELNASYFNNKAHFRFTAGARYYLDDAWNFEAEYGRDIGGDKTDLAKRRQIIRLGAARMLFGGLKSKPVDDHYTESKTRGLNLRGGIEHRVEHIFFSNREYGDFYYTLQDKYSYGITSTYLGIEYMSRKKRKSVDFNFFKGMSVNQRGWNHHFYFDVFLFSFLSNNDIEMKIYDTADYPSLVRVVTLQGPTGEYSPVGLKNFGQRIGYSLLTFNTNGSSHRIGFEMASPAWIFMKDRSDGLLSSGFYLKFYYTSTLPLF